MVLLVSLPSLDWLTYLVMAAGVIWFWSWVKQHPYRQRRQLMRGATLYFQSNVDTLPGFRELFFRRAWLLLFVVIWTVIAWKERAEPGGRLVLLMGALVAVGWLILMVLDLLNLPNRALYFSSAGILYVEEDLSHIPWEDVIVVIDYRQSIIIKTPEEIYEFGFEREPEDYQRLLESLEEVRLRHGLELPYIKC